MPKQKMLWFEKKCDDQTKPNLTPQKRHACDPKKLHVKEKMLMLVQRKIKRCKNTLLLLAPENSWISLKQPHRPSLLSSSQHL